MGDVVIVGVGAVVRLGVSNIVGTDVGIVVIAVVCKVVGIAVVVIIVVGEIVGVIVIDVVVTGTVVGKIVGVVVIDVVDEVVTGMGVGDAV